MDRRLNQHFAKKKRKKKNWFPRRPKKKKKIGSVRDQKNLIFTFDMGIEFLNIFSLVESSLKIIVIKFDNDILWPRPDFFVDDFANIRYDILYSIAGGKWGWSVFHVACHRRTRFRLQILWKKAFKTPNLYRHSPIFLLKLVIDLSFFIILHPIL